MSHATIPLDERQHGPIATYGYKTDVGRVRAHNEDNYLVKPPLFAVADGMGGHEAGEVASEIAVNVLAQQAPDDLDADALSHAVEAANYAILRGVEEGRGAEGMGTTLTAAMLKGERLLVAQVGDSRAYLLHQSRLQRITRDHSLMELMIETGQLTPEEAKTHPQRSVITRALGSAVDTYPDIYELNIAAGDRLLLCSDGLSGMVSEDEITEIMLRFRDPQLCANQLIKRANSNGGVDNVTAVVVDVEGNVAEQVRKTKRSSRVTVTLVALLLVGALFGVGFGLNQWISNSAYLKAEGEYVAIYQGIPDSFLGLQKSELIEVTTIKVDDLNAGLATRLKTEGVKADSLSEAQRLAQEYAEDAQSNKGNS